MNAVNALGTCGTREAVEPLLRLAKSSINPFTRNAVQKSIGQIQSRLGDVQNGWLSMDDLSEKDGALSVSDEAGVGSLSLEGDDIDESSDREK
jgi:hypothetical protein